MDTMPKGNRKRAPGNYCVHFQGLVCYSEGFFTSMQIHERSKTCLVRIRMYNYKEFFRMLAGCRCV
ncbi:hypothetical protein WG66_010470 [Moniliophthora roreri]|nr:hypothetical protein WG66_010470 [Moniliophthora roreri]